MGNVSSITQSRQKCKKDLKEWKKMVERQLAEKNKAIHDLREVLRVQNRRNHYGREVNEGLLLAIQQIEKQLQSKNNEDKQAVKCENCEKHMRVLESRFSVLTSYLRETNKRVDQMDTKHEQEESSHFKLLNDKMCDVEENVKRLECNVLHVENRVNHDMTVGKQELMRTLLQEIYELEDEKDGLLKFVEAAFGFGEQGRRIQLNEKLNSTLDKIRH